MSKFIDGIKFGLGIILIFGILFGIVYAVGFHSAEEILPGTFTGNFVFQGNLDLRNTNTNFTGANVSGLSTSSSAVPSGAVIDFELNSCPLGYTETSFLDVNEVQNSVYKDSQLSGYEITKLIDGSTSSTWATNGNLGVGISWVAFKYDLPKKITKIGMYPRASYTYLRFVDFNISVSSDSTNGVDGNWTVIASNQNIVNSASWSYVEFVNENNYNWYKISGQRQYYSASGKYYIQMSELDLFSKKVTCKKN